MDKNGHWGNGEIMNKLERKMKQQKLANMIRHVFFLP
jgi:hypothetical protein